MQNRRFLTNVLLLIKDFLFPSSCALCKTRLINPDEIKNSLCAECQKALKPIQGNKCIICGKPLISEMETCLPCRNREKESEKVSYERLWVIFPYIGKYRKLLTAYKFEKNTALAQIFMEKIKEIISENIVLQEAVIVPVPPRKGKIKDTGWDQVDYLVKQMESSSNYTVCRCLKRLKSRVQKSLNRTERLENLKGRIYADGNAPKTVLVIDDVITTGSTMEVCADVLKKAGAQKVYGLCLFYD